MKRYFFLLAAVSFFISGCFVFHKGSISSGPLMNKSDRYVDIGLGKSQSLFVLGFGSLKNEDLLFKAKNNLFVNRPLHEDEYYSNFTTSITNKFIFGFIHQTKVTVSADVMRSGDTTKGAFSKEYRRLIGSEKYLQTTKKSDDNRIRTGGNLLVPGDSVYYSDDSKNYKLFTVLSADKENVLLKASSDAQNNLLTPRKNQFFVRNVIMDGYQSGGIVVLEYTDEHVNLIKEDAKIMGVSEKHALVKSKDKIQILLLARLKRK